MRFDPKRNLALALTRVNARVYFKWSWNFLTTQVDSKPFVSLWIVFWVKWMFCGTAVSFKNTVVCTREYILRRRCLCHTPQKGVWTCHVGTCAVAAEYSNVFQLRNHFHKNIVLIGLNECCGVLWKSTHLLHSPHPVRVEKVARTAEMHVILAW
jgi:hypothetical protein